MGSTGINTRQSSARWRVVIGTRKLVLNAPRYVGAGAMTTAGLTNAGSPGAPEPKSTFHTSPNSMGCSLFDCDRATTVTPEHLALFHVTRPLFGVPAHGLELGNHSLSKERVFQRANRLAHQVNN